MGFFKKLNKSINKVGKAASKVVGGAANVVGKVASLPGVNMIPGSGLISNAAKVAGKVAGVVGGAISAGQSRGGGGSAMAPPPVQLAPQSQNAVWSGSANVGGVSISASGGGKNNTQTQPQTQQGGSWFQKNKIVVYISGVVVALIGLFLAFFNKKGGRRR